MAQRDKVRVYILARELNIETADLLQMCERAGFDVKNQISSLDSDQQHKLEEMVKQLPKSLSTPKPVTKPVTKVVPPVDHAVPNIAVKPVKREMEPPPPHSPPRNPDLSKPTPTLTQDQMEGKAPLSNLGELAAFFAAKEKMEKPSPVKPPESWPTIIQPTVSNVPSVTKESVTVLLDKGMDQPSNLPTHIPKIFISYRRDDNEAFAGRIYDRLEKDFGRDYVFMDVDAIPYGVDFRKHLSDAVGACDILLALIGEKWLTISKNGQRRLDDPRDFVRIEIEEALKLEILVIPVLLGKALMPREDELPVSLASLAYRNAAQIDSGRDFRTHMDRLIRGLEHLAKRAKS